MTGYPVVVVRVQAVAVMAAVVMIMVACVNMVVKYFNFMLISKNVFNSFLIILNHRGHRVNTHRVRKDLALCTLCSL